MPVGTLEGFPMVDPSTGTTVRVLPPHTPAEVARRLERAGAAAAEWRSVPLSERTDVLRRLADLLDEEGEDHATHIVQEMGKPVAQARAEVSKCAQACRHFADAAAEYLAPERVVTESVETWVRFDPLGLVLAIMPWNFPFFQVIRFLAPLMAAGNGTLLKPAPRTMESGERIADLAMRAGLPGGVVQTLRVPESAIPALIEHPAVRGVTFTGSTTAGRLVAGLAGAAGKRSLLELGGSDAVIVLADADVEAAARHAVASRLFNSGQSCIAAKRFIVQDDVLDDFVGAAINALDAAVVGDPAEATTDVGPLARDDLRDVLSGQVSRSLAGGARLARDGGAGDGPGFWYRPQLLVDVQPDHPVSSEETFGPVAAVTAFRDPGHAVALSNASAFGLGAAVWTRDLELARQLAGRLDVGTVAVNGNVKSDPRVPFGGVKASGYGRELGRSGIREFTNTKAVWVDDA